MAAKVGSTPFSGPLRFVALCVAAGIMVLAFIVVGFPYPQLADRIASEVQRSLGAQVAIRDLGPSLQLKGPGFKAGGLRIDTASGKPLEFERAHLRPAWSLSWLRGRPALHATIEGPPGNARGTFTLGSEPGFAGEINDVDLEALPLQALFSDLHLAGIIGIEMDVQRGLSGPEGWVRFELLDGSVAFGDFPLAIPYERILGSGTLGDEAFLEIENLKLDGPMMTADITGTIGSAPSLSIAPLKLQLQISAEPAIQNSLASAGVRFGGDGSARVRVSGTLQRPIIQ